MPQTGLECLALAFRYPFQIVGVPTCSTWSPSRPASPSRPLPCCCRNTSLRIYSSLTGYSDLLATERLPDGELTRDPSLAGRGFSLLILTASVVSVFSQLTGRSDMMFHAAIQKGERRNCGVGRHAVAYTQGFFLYC